MQESDTYQDIPDEGQEKCARDDVLIVVEARLDSPPESGRAQVKPVTDLSRLKPRRNKGDAKKQKRRGSFLPL